MTERKPPEESWESFAERKVREAQAEGAFDRLSGFGEPLPDIDEPLDENWWIRRKLQRENLQVVPLVLEARREKEKTLEAIGRLRSEREVRQRLQELNETIRQAHFSPSPGPSRGVQPVDIEATVREWRQGRR